MELLYFVGGGNRENEPGHVKMVAADTSNSASKTNEVHSNGSLSAEDIQKNLQKLAAKNNKTTKKIKRYLLKSVTKYLSIIYNTMY